MTHPHVGSSPSVRALDVYGRSVPDEVKLAQNKGNEDFLYPVRPAEMRTSSVFVVGDFMSTTFPNVGEQAVFSINKILARSSHLPPPHLLCQLANDLDKAMKNAAQGRHVVEFTMAAAVISNGDRLYYLTVGDCGINVYRAGRLHLLNGSNWVVPSMTVEATDEISRAVQAAPWPPSRAVKCGRGTTFIQPRDIDIFHLEKGDLVMFFSDGIERSLTPVDRLKLIEELPAHDGGKDPEALVQRTLSEARQRGGGDDCTLLALAGPFECPPSVEIEMMKTGLEESLGQIARRIEDSQQSLRSLEATAADLSLLAEVSNALTQIQNALGGLINDARAQFKHLVAENGKVLNKIDAGSQEIRALAAPRPDIESLRGTVAGVQTKLNEVAGSESRVIGALYGYKEELLVLLRRIEAAVTSKNRQGDDPEAARERAQVLTRINELSDDVTARLGGLADLAGKADLDKLRYEVVQSVAAMRQQDGAEGESRAAPEAGPVINWPEAEAYFQKLEENLIEKITAALGLRISAFQPSFGVVESGHSAPAAESPAAPVAVAVGAYATSKPAEAVGAGGAAVNQARGYDQHPPAEKPQELPTETKPADVPVKPSALDALKSRWSSWPVRRRALITAAALLALVSTIFLIWRAMTPTLIDSNVSSVNKNNNSNANANTGGALGDNTAGKVDEVQAADNRYSIKLRPDGWSLVIVRPDGKETRSNYFINPGSFKLEDLHKRFDSEPEALAELSLLAKSSRTLYGSNQFWKVEHIKGNPSVSVRTLKANEVKKFQGGDVCKGIADHYRMTTDDLMALNKLLDCQGLNAGAIKLDVGDILMTGKVGNKPPPAVPRPTPSKTPTPPPPSSPTPILPAQTPPPTAEPTPPSGTEHEDRKK